jgi:hypothetical protein
VNNEIFIVKECGILEFGMNGVYRSVPWPTGMEDAAHDFGKGE